MLKMDDTGWFPTLGPPEVSSGGRIGIHVVNFREDLRNQQLEWKVSQEREDAGVELLNGLLSSWLLQMILAPGGLDMAITILKQNSADDLHEASENLLTSRNSQASPQLII